MDKVSLFPESSADLKSCPASPFLFWVIQASSIGKEGTSDDMMPSGVGCFRQDPLELGARFPRTEVL